MFLNYTFHPFLQFGIQTLFMDTPRIVIIIAKLSSRIFISAIILNVYDLMFKVKRQHSKESTSRTIVAAYPVDVLYCALLFQQNLSFSEPLLHPILQYKSYIISTDEDPGLRIESFVLIKNHGLFMHNLYYFRHAKLHSVLVCYILASYKNGR